MDFESVFRLLLQHFEKYGVRFALMGGFALHAFGFTRATQDIDILVDKTDMPKVKNLMDSLGYELLHESEDVSNFLGKMKELGRVDFLHAHRQYAKNMLKRAKVVPLLNGQFQVRVILPEDMIGLKVQSSSNDPERYHQDMADIESLIRTQGKNLDLDLVKEYFTLFGREQEFQEILARKNNADKT